jgi:hypothetical protein
MGESADHTDSSMIAVYIDSWYTGFTRRVLG